LLFCNTDCTCVIETHPYVTHVIVVRPLLAVATYRILFVQEQVCEYVSEVTWFARADVVVESKAIAILDS